jgi:hypothetical protein
VAEIEFRLLGPLEVWRQGQRLAVGGAKPRALLVMLLLHANQAVGVDRLVDALWGEHPPTGAANALQAHVASLRRVLDRGRAGPAGTALSSLAVPATCCVSPTMGWTSRASSGWPRRGATACQTIPQGPPRCWRRRWGCGAARR